MVASPVLLDVERVRHRWGWTLALGIVMIVVGTSAFFMMSPATVGTVIVLGWLLIVSGVVEVVHPFRVVRWSGFFLHLVGGVIGVFIGGLIVTHPVLGALGWILLLSALFTVTGLFRLIAATALKFPNWGWAAFDGAVTLLLGILLWLQWPASGLWFLGFAVGFMLVLRGWSYVMLAFAVRNLPAPGDALYGDVRQAA